MQPGAGNIGKGEYGGGGDEETLQSGADAIIKCKYEDRVGKEQEQVFPDPNLVEASRQEEMRSGSSRLSMNMAEEMRSKSIWLSMCMEEERSPQAGQWQGAECAPLTLLARSLQPGADVIGRGKHKRRGPEEQEQVCLDPDLVEASTEEEMCWGSAWLSMSMAEEMNSGSAQLKIRTEEDRITQAGQRQGAESAPLLLLARNLQAGEDVVGKGKHKGGGPEEQGSGPNPVETSMEH